MKLALQLFSFLITLSTANAASPDTVDVYLLIGQSNMEGVGRRSKLPKTYKSVKNVSIYHSSSIGDSSTSNKWIPLKPAGWKGTASGGFGLEMSFGYSLNKHNPQKEYGLIKHAVGGTNLISDWTPGKGKQYEKFEELTNNALATLITQNKIPIIKGILWQQGEADARKIESAKAYEKNLVAFIIYTRNKFSKYSQDENPENIRFIIGQVIPSFTPGSMAHKQYPGREFIRKAAREVSKKLKNVKCVLTDDKSYQTHASEKDGYRDNDNIHFNGAGIIKIGQKMAEKAIEKNLSPAVKAH